MSLEEARRVRERLAARDLPEGWPDHVFAGVAPDHPIVPKCSMMDCAEPGIYLIRVSSLVAFTSSSSYACPGHLEHLHAAALRWVLA